MWKFEHSIVTDATKEQIWKVWSDVNNWSSWDHDIEYAKLDGKFTDGSNIFLKPKGSSEVKTELTNVQYLKSFTDQVKLPLATMQFHHKVDELDNGSFKLTHTVIISGLLSFIFSRVIGKGIAKGLPSSMEELIKKAKNL